MSITLLLFVTATAQGGFHVSYSKDNPLKVSKDSWVSMTRALFLQGHSLQTLSLLKRQLHCGWNDQRESPFLSNSPMLWQRHGCQGELTAWGWMPCRNSKAVLADHQKSGLCKAAVESLSAFYSTTLDNTCCLSQAHLVSDPHPISAPNCSVQVRETGMVFWKDVTGLLEISHDGLPWVWLLSLHWTKPNFLLALPTLPLQEALKKRNRKYSIKM